MVMTLSRGCGLPPNPRCGLPRSRASLITPLGGNTTDWRAGCGRSARPVRREGECFLALSLPLSSGRFKISPSSIFEDLRRNRMAQSIGFIGLGIMGQPMALNLVKAGYKVTAFNRTRSKAEALEKAGAAVVASPAEAARHADVVYIIVSDTAAVEEVVTGKGGILETLRSGAIVIDSSTISPGVSRKLACMSAGKGASWLDAPVTGSKHGAEKGELTFMIGGDRDVLERAMPVLQVLGKKHIYCG